MKIDYSNKTEKELRIIMTESYQDYSIATKQGKWNKAEKLYKTFSEAKHELRYVRNIY